ncbi:MAG: glycosyltransferase family 2 protein [Deferribacterales bacterium]
MPLLSIVTIVRNHKEGLLKTIHSVTSQHFSDYEYIVVDGASDDGTLDVINEHKNIFAAILYGPDGGIYDAMNKGLAKARGEYIIFMNAGDIFAHEYSLKDVFEKVKDNPDVIYGDYTVNYGYMKRYVRGHRLKDIWKGMLTSHQAHLVRASMAAESGFNCDLRLGADFDMIYRLYKEKRTFQYIPCEIAVTEPGGLSDKKRLTVYKNHLDTISRYGINPWQFVYYIYSFINAAARLWLKKILPDSMVRKIIKMKVDR